MSKLKCELKRYCKVLNKEKCHFGFQYKKGLNIFPTDQYFNEDPKIPVGPGGFYITTLDYVENYIYYGVREFGMSAIMNGISLHGGFIPYGGTF